MGKGEETRQRIVERAAPVFNRLGFEGASMSAIMAATGLQKGGLYRHFADKQELALAAFDHAETLVRRRVEEALHNGGDAADRLVNLIRVFERNVTEPVVDGGCHMLNTAVDSDDGNPALRERARTALDAWRRRIADTAAEGVALGELAANADADEIADVAVAAMEGAIMLAKIRGTTAPVYRAVRFLERYVAGLRRRDHSAGHSSRAGGAGSGACG